MDVAGVFVIEDYFGFDKNLFGLYIVRIKKLGVRFMKTETVKKLAEIIVSK